jgi:hypothetical protein
MRQLRGLLHGLGLLLFIVVGCKSQPNLKPPEEPQVLCTLPPDDKRNSEAFNYPQYTLTENETNKLALQGLTPTSGSLRPPGTVPPRVGSVGGPGGGGGGGSGP